MPAPCEPRSTAPRDRMARQTSGPRRWPLPTPYHRASLDTPSQRGWIAIPAPILTRDRALLIGVRLNQARINGKAFATNQAGGNACLDDPFEHTTKNVSLAEALVAGARERRMIRDGVLDTELAEPA
jgi:hypothetical protein